MRVLRVYHSAVVDEYRQRERLLRSAFGHDVHLVCPPRWSEGGTMVEARAATDFPVHVVPIRGPEHPILFWYGSSHFRRVLRAVRPEIVDLHEEPYSLAVGAALRVIRSEVPKATVCIYSAQNIYKRYPPPFRQLERRALATSAAAYPCSREAGEVLRAKGFTGALHVLPLGVTLPPTQKQGNTNPLRVGFLGRLEPYKGGEVAVRAFALATVGLDSILEMVGDGSQRQALEAIAQQLGLRHRVSFAGAVSQDEALRRIARYDIVVVPSIATSRWKEQFGRVAAQALAAGVPVVASCSGSLPEVLGGCGELVEEGDVVGLSTKLRELLHDPDRRAALGTAGRRRAIEVFSWQRVAEGFDRMYRQAPCSK